MAGRDDDCGWRKATVTIPLVFATDNNYMFPLFVAMQSAIQSAGRETRYEFHLLLSDDISGDNLKKLECMRKLHRHHDFIIHSLRDTYKGIVMRIEHVTSVTYYRLQIPSLLVGMEKCIYLDCDVCICQDLTELFRRDITGKYMAGVRAPRHCRTEKVIRENLSRLDIPSIDQYINAGVMLMNLDRIRKDAVEERFHRLVKNDYPTQDEDIINKVCYGMIDILPPRYNVMPYGSLSDMAMEVYQKDTGLQNAYSFDDWNAGRENPVIIHYATRNKPWKDLSVNYANLWWKTAQQLPFFEDVFRHYIDGLCSTAAAAKKQGAEG